MSGDHTTHQATQPGASENPAVASPGGQDQPAAPLCAQPPADRLIGIRELRQIFGLGRTAAYDLTHRPGFPTPVPFSPRCYRWWASEVAAFITALRTGSQNSPTSSRRRAQQPTPPQGAAHLRITGKVRAARSRGTPR